MKKFLLSFAFLASSSSAHSSSFDVYGLWLTQAEDAHIEVADCGDGTPCGSLVWVDPLIWQEDVDARNANEVLRTRPLIDVSIVWGYTRGRKAWRSGHIYNPEDGKTFKSTMRLQEDGTLKVKGCLGLVCITNIWTPVQNHSEPQ